MQVSFLPFKTKLKIAGLCLALTCFAYIDANAQLLEQGQSRLKSIRSEKPGFLFFKRKVKTTKTNNSNKGVFVIPHPESEILANRNKNPKPVKVRTSTLVSYNKKGNFIPIITSTPVSYNKKDRKVKIRTSTPVSYNKNKRFAGARTSFPVSYSPGEQKIKVRNSKPQKETYFNIWITEQMKSKRRIGPSEDPNNLYGKSKLSLRSPFVYRKKVSISGSMNYDMDKRMVDRHRPANDYTSSYKGDITRDTNPILHLKYRFGQWKRASYRGHHAAWNKSAKKSYYQFTSQTVSKHPGDTKVLIPFLANISDKMKIWEQSHYQGRSDGLSKFGKKDYERQQSILVSNFEGDIKVKRRKGGDMHPSIVYISGKRFSNTNWKERWRKLNIIWVRVNPGKETPNGAKEKYKVKYDKEERDIWTY